MIRFLFKTAFWFTVVVLFLPQNDDGTTTQSPKPDKDFVSTDMAMEAHKLLLQLQALCTKSPDICKASASSLSVLKDGSQESMDAIARFLSKNDGQAKDN